MCVCVCVANERDLVSYMRGIQGGGGVANESDLVSQMSPLPLLWHPHWFNSSVEVLGYGATDSTSSQVREHIGCIEQCGKLQPRFLNYRDFNSKVGRVIAVCVSYMFTTFYLMSICLTPLDVPPVRMHPC